MFLFLKEPNPEDPLNKEAAEVLQTNRRLFESNVQKSMRGGYIGTVYLNLEVNYGEKILVKFYLTDSYNQTLGKEALDKIMPIKYHYKS